MTEINALQSTEGSSGSPSTAQKLNEDQSAAYTENATMAAQRSELNDALILSEHAYNFAAHNVINKELLADYRFMRTKFISILETIEKTDRYYKDTLAKLNQQGDLCQRWADTVLQQISRNTVAALSPLVNHMNDRSCPLQVPYPRPLTDTSVLLQQSTLKDIDGGSIHATMRSRGANNLTKDGMEDDMEGLPSYG